MFQIAIYGKGGIGKSTVSANLSYALAKEGNRVLQVGCDPKHDSTRLLLGGAAQRTVLGYIRDVPPSQRRLEDVLQEGALGIKCVEAGGPEPGVGCAGRGILTTFDVLKKLGLDDHEFDIKVYDVLGDVVCGGFAVPLRREYADAVCLVTSGEFMSIYAANNILKGVRNFDGSSARVAGLIFNGRGLEGEDEMVERFARAVDLPILARVPRSALFAQAEKEARTVMEMFPDSVLARVIGTLSRYVIRASEDPSVLRAARPLDDDQLNALAAGRPVPMAEVREEPPRPADEQACPKAALARCEPPQLPAAPQDRKVVHTCATNGAVYCTSQIDGAVTIVHGPRSCAHIMSSSSDYYTLSSWKRNGEVQFGPAAARVASTDMDDHLSIFGGVAELERLIREELDKGFRTVFVVTTCASGIIGDDVASMAKRVEAELEGAEVKVIESDGNITGEWDQGYLDAVGKAIELVDRAVPAESGMVNIIAERDFFNYNRESNFKAAREVLGGLGLEVNCRFLCGCDIPSIRRFQRGGLSIMAQDDAMSRQICEMLRDRLGARIFDLPLPVGLHETVAWVEKLAGQMGKEAAGRSMVTEIREEYRKGTSELRPLLKGRKVLVSDNYSQDIDWLLDLLLDLDMVVLKAGLGPKHMPDRSRHRSSIVFQEDYSPEDMRPDIDAMRPDLILADHRLPQDLACRCDIVHRPDVGVRSSIALAKRWADIIRLPAVEGWKDGEER